MISYVKMNLYKTDLGGSSMLNHSSVNNFSEYYYHQSIFNNYIHPIHILYNNIQIKYK